MIFGIGIDIIEIQRVTQNLKSVGGLKQNLFTQREIAFCESRGRSAWHFAARFAAKEALLKAVGTGWRGGYRFNEIEIIDDRRGKPKAVVHGKVNSFCHKNRITGIHVSLSHAKNLAQAVVLLERSQPA